MDNNKDYKEILVKDKQGNIKLVKVVFDVPSTVSAPAVTPVTAPAEPVKTPSLPIQPIIMPVAKPVASMTLKPDFYFDVQDEEEVKRFKNKEDEELNNQKKNIVDNLAGEMINQLAFSLNESATKRFAGIIVSNLIGVRDNIDTRLALTKPMLRGGLGLTEAQAENAIQLMIKAKPEINKRLENYIKAKEEALRQKQEQDKIFRQQPSQPQPAVLKSELPVTPKTPTEAYVPAFNKERTKLADVQPVYRLISPVDELRSIDLNVFHRLADTTDGRKQKIRQKIDLLGDEGLTKMLQGIGAFKESPLYQLYLRTGALSFSKKISVAQVAELLQSQNDIFLTLEEFEAIADLSKEFSF